MFHEPSPREREQLMATRLSFIRRHRTAIASGVLPVLAAGSLVFYAISTRGNPPQEAHLNDAGVWLSTSQTSGRQGTPALFGLMNAAVSQFATSLTPLGATTGLDVIQDGSAVAGLDGQGGLIPIDAKGLRLNTGDAVKVGSAAVALGGNASQGSLAILDPLSGRLWATSFDATLPLSGLASVDPATAKPVAKVGAQSDAAVTARGVILAVSKSRGLTSLVPSGAAWSSHSDTLPSRINGNLTVTSVGDQPVVMALAQGSDSPTLVLPGGRVVELTHRATGGGSKAALLQQPGPDAAEVLIGTATALLGVDLKDGHVRTIVDGSGSPVAPVLFGDCAFGAWQGPAATEARACRGDVQTKPLPSDTGQAITDLVFRVNHDHVLLNDRTSGQAWDDQTGTPLQVADWQAVQRPSASSQNQTSDTTASNDKNKAATANPDTLGARPGRVTTLHVLDNDKTLAGTVLTVNAVYGATSQQATVTVAPDHQSVLADLSPTAAGSFSFQYDVTNGSGKASNKATVKVPIVPLGTNAPPELRTGFAEPSWYVPVNGVVTIPVLTDWRNYANGDPPALAALDGSSTHQPGAHAIATSDGDILYSAGKDPGTDVVKYAVVDGDKRTVASLTVIVQGRTARAVAPIAHDDFVEATVGRPARFLPLANDLPGSDPLTAGAVLKVAGVIKGQNGLAVGPPAADGSVTVTPTAPGHYKLSYQDSYGSVNSAPAVIRVDAGPADVHAKVLAAPDSVTVRGQASTILDPVVNDSSPLGNLLTVVGVQVSSLTNLQVAVVHGRYLRVSQRESRQIPTTETFTYSVTDGVTSTAAQVTVSELPALLDDAPLAATDRADVRRGDSVLVPVLENDVDPGGDALSLVADQPGGPPAGQLTVRSSAGAGRLVGEAFVAGDQVRYVAPPVDARVTQAEQVSITYIAKNGAGQTDTGHVLVTIRPNGSIKTDQAPEPRDLEARVVSGGTVIIPVPTSGVDPDGDTVQVQGLALPATGEPQPKLGALVSTSANSVSYQAYPSATNAGTDTFTYQVTDTYGLSARATIRVAVVQPTILPAPVARNIDLTAAPGSLLDANVVNPRNIDYADGAPPTLLDPAASTPDHMSIATLDRKRQGWLNIRVPKSANGNLAAVPYSVVADLGAPSGATINIALVPGYHPPPVTVDEFAKPKPGATSVSVNLLAGDYSPTRSELSVQKQEHVTGSTLTVNLTPLPQVIPFVVTDKDGASASAVAYVPANGAGSRPYWNGKVATVPAGSARTFSLGDYVVDPSGARLSLTSSTAIWASPALGLSSRIAGSTSFRLTGAAGYQGPGSVTIEVTRTGALNDFAVITVPVLVGNPTPVLRCPSDVISVEAGLVDGSGLSPASQCHVWTPASIDPTTLRFHLTWAKDPGLVDFKQNDAARDVLLARHDAKPGSTGVLTVALVGYGSKTSTLDVKIVPAPSITVKPISVQGILTTGAPTVINLAGYVNSPFGFGSVSIVQFGSIPDVQIRKSSKGSLTITATKKQLSGIRQLPYVVTDLTNISDRSRQKPGSITLQFIGVPGVPSSVTPRPGFFSEVAHVTWTAPIANGARIDDYVLSYKSATAAAGTFDCHLNTQCDVVGLNNGSNYTFSVKAHNIAGPGDASPYSAAGKVDILPQPVTDLRAVNPSDHQETLTWRSGGGKASAVGFSYTITWDGTQPGHAILTDPGATSYVVKALDNNSPVTFFVTAANQAGPAGARTAKGQSAGKPGAPLFSSGGFTPTKTAGGKAAAAISWSAVSPPNGPGPVVYSLLRIDDSGANPKTVCAKVLQTQCTDTPLDTGGQFYRYKVFASNAVFDGLNSAETRVESTTPPEDMNVPVADAPTATDADGSVTLHFTTAPSHGKDNTVLCSFTSDGNTPTKGSPACPTSPWAGYQPGGGQSVIKSLTGLGDVASVQFVVWEDNGSAQNTAYRYGAASGPSAAVTTNGPPNPPTGGSCGLSGAGGNDVTFSWTAPAKLNGRPIVYYFHNADFAGGPSTSTSATHTYPQDLASHTLLVYTQDSAGEKSGELSVPCPDHQPATPGAPGNAGCGLSGNDVTFKWTAPASNGLTYTYSYSNPDFSGPTSGLSATHTYGADGVSHTLTVTTYDVRGPGGSVNITCTDAPVPPPQPSVSIAWGSRASSSLCGGDTSCRYWTVTWSNFPSGNHSVAAVFNGSAYCSGTCSPRSGSGSSGSLTYWTAGYCLHHYNVDSTVDNVPSNTIYTNDASHPC